MPTPDPSDLTGYLNALGRGEVAASTTLMPVLYAELKAIAEAHLRGGNPAQTLQPTMLVHSAYLKLFKGADVAWNDRKHFFVIAARAMRQIVIDHARGRGRLKRGEGRAPVTLDGEFAAAAGIDFDLLDLDEALEELHTLDERQARTVELRFFAGLSVEDVAKVMDVSLSTAERDWRFARAWLGKRLG